MGIMRRALIESGKELPGEGGYAVGTGGEAYRIMRFTSRPIAGHGGTIYAYGEVELAPGHAHEATAKLMLLPDGD